MLWGNIQDKELEMIVRNYQKLYHETLVWITTVHGDQKYDKDLPYIFHLVSVENVLTRFGFSLESDIKLHIAALCHDAVEDTKVELKEILKRYGEDVEKIVDLVTDEKGATRSERHKKTYPKLAVSEDAVIVKLSDRIANVEYGISVNNLSQYRKYIKEYNFFRDTLYNPKHTRTIKMWEHLDSLLKN